MVAEGVDARADRERRQAARHARSARCSSSTRPRSTSASRSPRRPGPPWATPTPRAPADDVLFALADLGRLGRKAKAGFYAYDDKGKRQGLWPGLARRSGRPAPSSPRSPTCSTASRMIQALEAVRALEEGVLTDIREGDVGAILGWGFMPWSGGPFAWLDILGAARAVEICDALAAAHGPRFAAAEAPARPGRSGARASTAASGRSRRPPDRHRPRGAAGAAPGASDTTRPRCALPASGAQAPSRHRPVTTACPRARHGPRGVLNRRPNRPDDGA